MVKVIVIEPKKEPYFKDVELSAFGENMNFFAEAEIGCRAVDRIQLKSNYELTMYCDDWFTKRGEDEYNFSIITHKGVLDVLGKVVISRAHVIFDDMRYDDVTAEDLTFVKNTIIRK